MLHGTYFVFLCTYIMELGSGLLTQLFCFMRNHTQTFSLLFSGWGLLASKFNRSSLEYSTEILYGWTILSRRIIWDLMYVDTWQYQAFEKWLVHQVRSPWYYDSYMTWENHDRGATVAMRRYLSPSYLNMHVEWNIIPAPTLHADFPSFLFRKICCTCVKVSEVKNRAVLPLFKNRDRRHHLTNGNQLFLGIVAFFFLQP